MKFFIIKLLIICVLLFGIDTRSTRSKARVSSKNKSLLKAHMKTTYWVRPLIKTSKFYHSFANLAYCPGDVINQLGCPLCDNILDNSFEVFKYYKHKHRGYTFTFIILFSVNRNEAVIALSGPKSPHPTFYSTIYSRGFVKMAGHPDIVMEKTYLEVYQGKFQSKLFAAVQDYNDKFNVNEKDHKYVFVGHSFGGSLAILSAFDLVSKKVVPNNPAMASPLVYAYGSLRIGNNIFVNQTNALFKVIRIVKSGDYYPRMPTCSWSPSINRFRCEEEWDYSDVKKNPRPELLNYIQNYYGVRGGGLASGINAAYSGPAGRMSFLEKVNKKKKQVGWSYASNNPGYMMNNLGTPFDEIGRTNDDGRVSYSQPLGAEVLFSNNFKRHTICSYFYGIPNCEAAMNPVFNKNVGKTYFNSDVTDC